ncbi:MAG: Gfo/Idh/MocA family oxidoreductase [Deltaproteobacteria bacterium]|nr:Gfo/Idh/MocA family oxidoreductase [Deltaproteobacteria bacterium]MBN2670842.1 Gfo/Idh/MocA family oxidoreductase [Deltaproteobacteria bacterium]
MKNFALIGAAGYIAPRHMQAIKETGHRLVAVADPADSVGVLDRYFLDVRYFPEIERFDRHLEKLRHGPEENKVHFVSICSPNYLHDAHVRLALRSGCNAICEKPLVINPWNLDQLAQVERETGNKVNTIMQLRLHPTVIALKEKLIAERTRQPDAPKKKVSLEYLTGRGPWYQQSWKGREERSGGLVTNIGIHFFDMLLWLFGEPEQMNVTVLTPTNARGTLSLKHADVTWHLSVDFGQLPFAAAPGQTTTYRSITIDGEALDFTGGFTDLHTRSYEEILNGNGFGIDDARPAIELVHRIRQSQP